MRCSPFEQPALSADEHHRSAQEKALVKTCEEPTTWKARREPNNAVLHYFPCLGLAQDDTWAAAQSSEA